MIIVYFVNAGSFGNGALSGSCAFSENGMDPKTRELPPAFLGGHPAPGVEGAARRGIDRAGHITLAHDEGIVGRNKGHKKNQPQQSHPVLQDPFESGKKEAAFNLYHLEISPGN